jgi:hypothetical protein
MTTAQQLQEIHGGLLHCAGARSYVQHRSVARRAARSMRLRIARAEAGEWQPVVLDLALFCAMASVRPDDRVDHARFARLLQHAQFAASGGREPGGSFARPSAEEIEHWRDVVFGRDQGG